YEGTKMVQRGMLSTYMAIHIFSTLKGMELDIRAESGTTLKNRRSGEVIYTPPVGQQLLIQKLDNWAKFMHEESSFDPLVRMAVQHYQFEAIHPFSDGNGRTGRILNILFLVQHGLLDSPILYLSRYIIQHKAAYYRLLLNVTRDQDWAAWILFMLDGVEETCTWTTDKIKSIRELMQHTGEFVQSSLPKIYSWELVELLFKQPYCRIGNLVDAGIAKRQTASVYLKQLCELGVLREIKSGRENLFVHPKYIELLSGEENVWIYYDAAETDAETAG
ncbi:MAG: Fic family protein, partial [Woeseiaceae bacterium]